MKNRAQYHRTAEAIRQIDLLLLNDDGAGWELRNARDNLEKYRDRVRPDDEIKRILREG